jgi:hypothetical protein
VRAVQLGACAGLLLLLGGAAAAAAAAEPDHVRGLYLEAVRLMTEGRHEEATAAFEHLIDVEPQHAGAWLELALNHCTLGHPAEAERLFREIEVRFAPSAGILEVINSHRSQGCQPWRPKTVGSVTLSRGTDSNVNQGTSNPVFVTGSGPDRVESLLSADYLPRRDSYLQTAFEATRELNQRGAIAFAQLRVRRNDVVSDQDTNALLVGADRPFGSGPWSGRGMGSVSMVSLGGKLYQRQFQLQARSALPLPLPEHYDLTLSAALGNIAYLTRKKFDSNTGEISALLNYRGASNQQQLAFGALVDRGEAGRLGGNRHGWYTGVQWQRQFGARLNGELGWTRQDWRGQTVYFPGLIDAVREQSTRQWRASLTTALTPTQGVQLEWRHVQNKENISLFQYNSQAVQLNWRWNGF